MSAALALKVALPEALGRIREPAKVVAFNARVSKRTIDSARRGEHVLTAGALLDLARQYPEIKALVVDLIGGVENDPAYLMHLLQKHIEAKR